ncbi:hypothetical protein [Pseudochryseolinea flava]|uniref:Glycosyltransferase family 1 protein n=1 Tax=Pseudochryseolinea flava TaxID=2059302 RepID=A0A364Y6C6_9BACT|nr:hypothetical protein [Pseudochryseolinea flava]RAW02646.1 hypothetical protein DQQ10_00620 [Pseudochryseolinea flava]
MSLRNRVSRLKWFLINIKDVVRMGRFYQRDSDQKRIVYLDLERNPYDRYLYSWCLFFQISGYNVVFRMRYGLLGSWATSMIVRANVNAYFSFSKPDSAVLTVTNISGKQHAFDFFLTHDYFTNHERAWYLSMPMVDSFYVDPIFQYAKEYQQNDVRNLKVFFAGRFVRDGYNRSELKDYFNMYSRLEQLALVKKNFTGMVITPTTLDVLEEQRSDIVIVDRDIVNVPPHRLYKALSKAEFFLSFAGVVMPLCHNVVEAMAFGSIPIIQNPLQYHPALVDGENCLAFSNEHTLVAKLQEALTMPPSAVAEMRKNVIAYYNKYLAPQQSIANVMAAKGHCDTLVIVGEYRSLDFLRASPSMPQ